MGQRKHSPDDTMSAVRDVAGIIRCAGGRALLVGGCVRDSLLPAPTPSKDFDLEVYGFSHDNLERVLASHFDIDFVGRSFGVFKLHHYDIDVALPRRETKLGLGHKSFSIQPDPSMTIEEAASRRDFTVNAIYRDPLTDEIIDPFGGACDLKAGVLRHVSSHFSEDPLRVLRGMQMVARFGLEPADETVDVCRAMTPENLPKERLFEEWSKLLLKGKVISSGLKFLRAVNWVRYYPELASLIGCRQARQWHPEGDVWNHTLCSLDVFAANRDGWPDDENLIVALAVLCHDFGKPSTTYYNSVKKRLCSPGHDVAGVAPAQAFLGRLTDEVRVLRDVCVLVKRHMSVYSLWACKRCSDAAIRRLAAEVGRIDRLLRVAAADDAGRPPFPSNPEPMRWLGEQAERLRIMDSAPKAIVQGRDLIRLGLKPSPLFGEILSRAYDAQIDGAFFDVDGGVEFCKRLLNDMAEQE